MRDALTETQREAKRRCVLLCKVSSVLKLSHFSERLLCSDANCYGDEAVAPSYVRFTELLVSSFHFQFAGFEIQIFAMMSGIFDLSSDEKAKHFLPRWFKDAPT